MTESSLARTISAWTKLIGASIILALALTGCVGLPRPTEENTEVLAQAAEAINKICPMTVDADTRLDNTVALPGKVLGYNYTLVKYAQKDLSATQLKSIEETMAPQLREKVRTSSEMKSLRDYGTTFKYVYRSNDGVELMTITVSPEDYS